MLTTHHPQFGRVKNNSEVESQFGQTHAELFPHQSGKLKFQWESSHVWYKGTHDGVFVPGAFKDAKRFRVEICS